MGQGRQYLSIGGSFLMVKNGQAGAGQDQQKQAGQQQPPEHILPGEPDIIVSWVIHHESNHQIDGWSNCIRIGPICPALKPFPG